MTISDLNRYALTVFALVTVLASCNSGGSQVAPLGSMQQSAVQSDVNANAAPGAPTTRG